MTLSTIISRLEAEIEAAAIEIFESNPSRNPALEWRHAAVPKKRYRLQAKAALMAGRKL